MAINPTPLIVKQYKLSIFIENICNNANISIFELFTAKSQLLFIENSNMKSCTIRYMPATCKNIYNVQYFV